MLSLILLKNHLCNYSFLCLSIAHNLETFFATFLEIAIVSYILPSNLELTTANIKIFCQRQFLLPTLKVRLRSFFLFRNLPNSQWLPKFKWNCQYFFYYRFTPNKIKQLLKGNELHEKGEKEERHIGKIIVDWKEPMKKRDLLTPDLQPFIS